MYNSSFGDRSIVDKMMRLFIIQAISSFVSRDYDSGLHYLNEVKTHFAQNQSTLNSTLKGLAKEIIQSLDMLAPGADATQFMNMQTGHSTAEPQRTEPVQENYHTVGEEFKAILKRRKKKEPKKPQEPHDPQEDDLFASLGELRLKEEEERRDADKREEKITPVVPSPSEMSPPKQESITKRFDLSEKKLMEEDNAIIEVLLKRKKLRGELSKEDEKMLQILQDRKRRREEEQNPIESIRRKRKRRRSKLWDDD